jgi:Domain of unknown function (DUF4304)
MSQSRDNMIDALKRIVVPALRGRGFSGSLPHLRRSTCGRIDLLTFQFDRYGGGFVIEIAQCPPEGFTTSWGEKIPPNKVKAWDLHPDHRFRLQPVCGSGTDSWFRFDSGDVEVVAQSLLPFLEQAEAWYAMGRPTGNAMTG